MAFICKNLVMVLIFVVAGAEGMFMAASSRTLAMGGLLRSLPKHIASPLASGSVLHGNALSSGSQALREAGKHVLQAASGSGGTRAAAKEWGKKAAAATATVAQEAGSRTVTLARTFPEAYMRVMQTRPIVVCGFLEGMRHLVGDVISQRIEQNGQAGSASTVSASHGLEVERLSVLTAWGALYGSTLGYQSYHNVYPAMFGIVGTRAALKTTCMDLLVTCPFIYYPVWHVFKEATDRMIAREGPPFSAGMGAGEKFQATCKYGREIVGVGWDNYKTNFVSDTLAMAAVWAPLHMVNFRFIPLTHRFPFIATAGIIWTTVFSYLQFGAEGH